MRTQPENLEFISNQHPPGFDMTTLCGRVLSKITVLKKNDPCCEGIKGTDCGRACSSCNFGEKLGWYVLKTFTISEKIYIDTVTVKTIDTFIDKILHTYIDNSTNALKDESLRTLKVEFITTYADTTADPVKIKSFNKMGYMDISIKLIIEKKSPAN